MILFRFFFSLFKFVSIGVMVLIDFWLKSCCSMDVCFGLLILFIVVSICSIVFWVFFCILMVSFLVLSCNVLKVCCCCFVVEVLVVKVRKKFFMFVVVIFFWMLILVRVVFMVVICFEVRFVILVRGLMCVMMVEICLVFVGLVLLR